MYLAAVCAGFCTHVHMLELCSGGANVSRVGVGPLVENLVILLVVGDSWAIYCNKNHGQEEARCVLVVTET